MMHRHPLVPGHVGAWWSALLLALVAGCGVFNPSLVGTVTPSGANGIEPPSGTILIAVLNASPATAAAEVQVVKKDGGVVSLVIPVQPADNDPSNEADHATMAQDCDVQSIQLTKILAFSASGGYQEAASNYLPLTDGVELDCGKVVVITITGNTPNILATVQVF
jgi:hypothetical protein